ncbi:unnamed protein product [Phaedon cochleariae]|uniref:Uncharacterized protein n=1 Tax=Phaedon cochleariae TaxID=80249 RepID=A0A9N9SJH4_PHACE|nr:unnamed protein product [Phaedon cochleariae]
MSLSQGKRFKQILSSGHLGDQKPSQLLRKLQQLIGDTQIDQCFLREIFLQKLPNNIQVMLSCYPDSTVPIEELASKADSIMESAIDCLNFTHNPVTHSNTVDISAELNELKNLVSRMCQDRSKSKPLSQSMDSRKDGPVLCWYHSSSGPRAKKCMDPCSESENFKLQHQ